MNHFIKYDLIHFKTNSNQQPDDKICYQEFLINNQQFSIIHRKNKRVRERTIVNYVQLALRGRRKEGLSVNLVSCRGKIVIQKSPMSMVSVAESEAENVCVTNIF